MTYWRIIIVLDVSRQNILHIYKLLYLVNNICLIYYIIIVFFVVYQIPIDSLRQYNYKQISQDIICYVRLKHGADEGDEAQFYSV